MCFFRIVLVLPPPRGEGGTFCLSLLVLLRFLCVECFNSHICYKIVDDKSKCSIKFYDLFWKIFVRNIGKFGREL